MALAARRWPSTSIAVRRALTSGFSRIAWTAASISLPGMLARLAIAAWASSASPPAARSDQRRHDRGIAKPCQRDNCGDADLRLAALAPGRARPAWPPSRRARPSAWIRRTCFSGGETGQLGGQRPSWSRRPASRGTRTRATPNRSGSLPLSSSITSGMPAACRARTAPRVAATRAAFRSVLRTRS